MNVITWGGYFSANNANVNCVVFEEPLSNHFGVFHCWGDFNRGEENMTGVMSDRYNM